MKNKALSLLKCQIRLDESIESNTVSKLMMSVWGLVLWIFTSSSEVRTSEYLRAVFSLVKEWNSRNNVYRYTYRCIQYVCVQCTFVWWNTWKKWKGLVACQLAIPMYYRFEGMASCFNQVCFQYGNAHSFSHHTDRSSIRM